MEDDPKSGGGAAKTAVCRVSCSQVIRHVTCYSVVQDRSGVANGKKVVPAEKEVVCLVRQLCCSL
jgi:hypothetical protein